MKYFTFPADHSKRAIYYIDFPTMDHLIHLPEFQLIVCKKCQYAVLPSHIDTHFATKPHKLGSKERQRIARAVAEINRLIENEEALQQSEFTFPPTTSPPIAALGKPEENGLQCTVCQYICCNIKGMQNHQWEEHEWKSQQKRGRPKKSNEDKQVPWRTGVHCQRFFSWGHKSGYFEVRKAEPTPRPSTCDQPDIASRIDQFEAAKRELEAALRKAELEERRVIKEAEESREPNPWLRRVRWAAHLVGLDKMELREWVETPREEEPKLEILCKAFDWMIQEAQNITVQEVVGLEALFTVNRKEVTSESQMPFDSWMGINTVRKYTHVWRQVLCYIFRAEDAEPEKRPAYKLTRWQQTTIASVRSIIQEFQEWKEDQPKDDDEGESDEEIEFMGRI